MAKRNAAGPGGLHRAIDQAIRREVSAMAEVWHELNKGVPESDRHALEVMVTQSLSRIGDYGRMQRAADAAERK